MKISALMDKLSIQIPMFVVRQHTPSVNEMSTMYSVIPEDFFVPEEYQTNNQGPEGKLDLCESLAGSINEYKKLHKGSPIGCGIDKRYLSEVFEPKNRANTMNSSSTVSSVIDKLIEGTK